MGSFLQLVAVYSDLPCRKDDWLEAQMMESRQNCPTGAIPSDRFLIRAERCIVFHNEKPSNIPFPSWINVSWHNCLVGCLHCQNVCPHNKNFSQWIEGKEDFSPEETGLLLEGVPRDQLPAATMRKLEQLDLIGYLESLRRNLGVFFKKSEQSGNRSCACHICGMNACRCVRF
jgi:epoxyqueuosine reductase